MQADWTMTRCHWRGLTAGLGLLLLSVAPGQASSLTVGQNYQESSNKTSTTPPAGTACNATTFCYIEFAKVPLGRQLVVTQVSCSLSVSNNSAEVVQMTLSPRRPGGAAVERFQMLIPSTLPSNLPGYNLVLNSNAYQLFDAGDRPEIFVSFKAGASVTGFCSISGQIVNNVPG
jgi:hypothetical protein